MERSEKRTHVRTAVPSAWKTIDLPARRASVTLDRVFSREEMDHIRQGVIPEVMEDKWFIYWKDDAFVLPSELDRILHLRRTFRRRRGHLEDDSSGRESRPSAVRGNG